MRTGNVWIGGETGFFQPFIAKSTDMGDNWDIFLPDLGGDNACNSFEFYQADTNVVFAGMEGLVIKTTDGGLTWNSTGLTNTPYYFFALAYNNFGNILFAGGSTNSNEFGLYYSNDGGDNWIQFQPAQNYKGISAMVIIATVLPEIYNLYISTLGDGVLRLQIPVTGINNDDILLKDFKLSQNYPNPFNPTTSIEYRVGSREYVTLKVYDILGREVATLVNEEKQPGVYEVEFDAAELASGIYYYQLKAGSFIETNKMIYLK
jgi:hypothetical protein